MITTLTIQDYRNIKNIEIHCSTQSTIFIGQNGQGKTNILESIYNFSTGKPFRGKTSYEAIPFEAEAFHLFLETESSSLEIHCAQNPRKKVQYKVNKIPRRFFDFLGHFDAVLFSPEDLAIIRGTPGKRRDYIDSILIRIDKQYAYELAQYDKILKQRNALLKAIQKEEGSRKDLETWNPLLRENAEIIWEKRKKLIAEIQELLEKKYQKLSQKKQDIRLIYNPKKDSEDFLEDLEKRMEKDIILGSTSVGPHRDDFCILIEKQEASQFASQGETRSLILALKFIETRLLEEKHGKKVVLLLDDVFSELDKERQKALLDLAHTRQTFITTTHLDSSLEIEGEVLQVINGEIK